MLWLPEDFAVDTAPSEIAELLMRGLSFGDLELPAMNSTVVRLLELCRDESYQVDAVVDLIGCDPALAARLLRVANSSVFAPTVPIASISHAVTRLGARSLSEIALALMLQGQVFRASSRHASRVQAIWLHSALAGVYGRQIGIALHGPAEASMLEGLLHDVGHPVVIRMLDEVEGAIGEQLPDDVVDGVLRELHAELGGVLVRDWGLPASIEAAVALHHRPFAVGEHREAALVAHLADALAHWAADPDDEEEARLRDHLVIRTLNLGPEAVDRILLEPARAREQAAAY